MDRELLSSMNNLSEALEALSESLTKKGNVKSGTATALTSGDFGKQLTQISTDVQEIKTDSKKILKNQETILQFAKEKDRSKTGLFGDAGDPKRKDMIKQGVGMVLLIAGGVLAIGLAFKLIGEVDFLSVLALSVSLPLVAMAFEKIATMKDLTPANMLNLILVTGAMSIALVISSYILSKIQPIGIFQGITAIMIAGTFAAIAPHIVDFLKAFKEISVANALKAAIGMPILLVAISTAIALSSHVLGLVQPIGLYQAITGIYIAGMFGVISMGLGNLLSGFKGLKPSEILLVSGSLPLLMVGISLAIAGSSWILAQIQPIGLFQFFTALFIAVTFIPISYAVGPIVKSLKDIEMKDILKLPLVLVAMATAITLSSFILVNTQPIGFGMLVNIVLQSIALSVASLALGLTLGVIGKIPLETLAKGAVGVLIIAGTIALSSLILGLGDYGEYPSYEWVGGVSLSILTFGIATIVLGALVESGLGLGAIASGAVGVLLVVATIMASSLILGLGDYDEFPSYDWVGGVSLSILTFGIATIALGALIMSGIGAVALVAGAVGVLGIAATIVGAGAILSTGTYANFPSLDWAAGVGLTLLSFGASSILLGAAIMTGIGGVAIWLGLKAVKKISHAIVDVAQILGQGSYSLYPGLKWAIGVGASLVAFAAGVVALALLAPVLAIGLGLVLLTSGTIFAVDLILRQGEYSKYPNADWKSGAIVSLLEFGAMSAGLALISPLILIGSAAALVVSATMIATDAILSTGKYAIYPSKQWATDVSGAMISFLSILGSTGLGDIAMNVIGNVLGTGPVDIAKQIVGMDRVLSKGSFKNYPTEAWVKGVAGFGMLGKVLKDISFDKIDSKALDFNLNILTNSYDRLAESITNLSGSITTIDTEKLMALKSLTGNIVLMSLMDPEQFGKMMDALDQKAAKFNKVFDVLDVDGNKKIPATVTIGTRGGKGGKGGKTDSQILNEKMDVLIGAVADIGTVVGSHGTLKEYLEGIHKDNTIGSKGKHSIH